MNAAALAVHGFWKCIATPPARRFHRAMENPEPVQRGVLARILRENARTEFGCAHGFSRLKNVEDYQNAVPPRDYAEHESWIRSAAAGKNDVLFPGRATAFLPTSGTLSGVKLIPWAPGLKRDFHEALGPWIHGFMRSHPAAWRGTVYWSLSPPAWPADRTAGGIRIGFDSDASYLPSVLRPLLASVFAVPSAVAGIRDVAVWKYATLLHLLGAGNLSMISIWSPTYLTSLLAPLEEWWDPLLRDLENRTFTPPMAYGHAKTALTCRRGGGRRAAQLRALSRAGGVPGPDKIWPRLAAISCWTDAAAQGPSQRLAALFPHAKVIGKGLVATEGVVSIPWPEADAPALALTSHFLEFMDDAGVAHPAWDMDDGGSYTVLLTTGGGLYRYRLNDRIRVVGFCGKCPLIRFIGRDGVTSDLCGEKLAEPFVRECLERVSRESCQVWPFAMLAPCLTGEKPFYRLYLSCDSVLNECALADALEAELCDNGHYAHARRIGQLGSLKIIRVPHDGDRAWLKYQSAMAARGQRLGDIKPTALSDQPGWELVFGPAE